MICLATPTYLHAEEAMEEGEVDEASLAGKGRLNEAARAMVCKSLEVIRLKARLFILLLTFLSNNDKIL